MKRNKKHVYCEIAKSEKQPDGTLMVYGYASSGAVDADGEIITPAAMKAAIPDYMKFGAVREMHQASAAGTAVHIEVDEVTGKTEFQAHIVDPVAVLKVETGTYKGFSVGGGVLERNAVNKKQIDKLNLIEVSLVDRPCNPEATLEMFKAEKTDEDHVTELAELLDSGAITPAALVALAKGQTPGNVDAAGAPDVPAATNDVPPAATDSSSDTSEKSAEAADLKKGLHSVSRLACLLNELGYLVCDTAWEATYEGDNSPLPAALTQWLKDGAAILNVMVEEEVNELLAGIQSITQTPEVIAMAAKAGLATTIQKKGAKFSKQSRAALASVHKMIRDGDQLMSALKYEAEEAAEEEADDAEPAADDAPAEEPKEEAKEPPKEESADKVAKAAPSADDTDGIGKDDTLEKTVSAAIQKAIAPLEASLQKVNKENEDLKAQVVEMGKRAAPGKAFLKAVSFNKEQDGAPANTEPEEKLAAEGTPERAQQEMRKVFASPVRLR